MRMRYLLAGTALLATMATTAAMAENPGLYVNILGGWNQPRDADISGAGFKNEVSYDAGWAAGAAIGYALRNGVRLELEFTYRWNDVDFIKGVSGASGDVKSYTGMVNAIYDINTDSRWTPYVGIGLGVNHAEQKVRSSATSVIDDSDTAFAVQGILGLAYALTDHVRLTADYRYMAAISPSYKGGGREIDQHQNHTMLVGLRYAFGPPPAKPVAVAPPPPPPPPTPQPPQRNFLVFFDFDKYDITPEAQRVIAQAHDNYRRANVTRLNLTGHTDRAGSDRYNQALSLRRANAVKAAMMRLGVPENQIAVVGKGESQPLVPTADGVREPQNRRVEIVF